MQVGPIGVFHEAANYDWSYEDIVEEGDQRFASTGGWLGFSDKYWLTALVPPQSADISAAFRRGANGGLQANYTVEPTIVAPGKAITHDARLFAGVKARSEEQTSELKSLRRISYDVFCLQKKKP